MKIIDLVNSQRIMPSLQATTKKGVLEEMTAALVKEFKTLDPRQVVTVLLERENLGSTGIGDNIAIPHGKLAHLENLVLCFGRSVQGIDFDSMDGKPTHLFFLLLAPENSIGLHLKALAKISRLLKDSSFRRRLMEAPDAAALLDLLGSGDVEP